jgi:gluconate 2-dehydrogenase gamma chain
MKYNRREFIKTLGLLSGSVLLLPACTSTDSGEHFRILTEKEAACLIALCEQIIPGDQDAGATDAGVIYFIDRQLKKRFPKEIDLFRNGVHSLQDWCKERYGQVFEDLDVSLQIEIMQQMEKDEISSDLWTVSPKDFFNRLLARTMQGFYGSPRHGGNKDYASYRMLKLDYPLLIGQNRYLKL